MLLIVLQTQVPCSKHVLMKYADHYDVTFGDTEVDCVSPYLESSIPLANVIASARNLRLIRQLRKRSGNFIRVTVCLRQPPFA